MKLTQRTGAQAGGRDKKIRREAGAEQGGLHGNGAAEED